MMTPAVLLANLTARGVEFHVDGDKLRFRPATCLTPDEFDAVRQHKTALLALIRPMPSFDENNAAKVSPRPVLEPPIKVKRACRCDSTTWRDVPIHDGQSVRRDCGRCGRFIEFAVWHGKDAGQKDQYPIG
jgi:hypothetical protein